MQILVGASIGLLVWFLLRFLLTGVYTVDQNERAVKTCFRRAVRVPGGKTSLTILSLSCVLGMLSSLEVKVLRPT